MAGAALGPWLSWGEQGWAEPPSWGCGTRGLDEVSETRRSSVFTDPGWCLLSHVPALYCSGTGSSVALGLWHPSHDLGHLEPPEFICLVVASVD